ncbi:MAG TPA: ATP synthase subunit C, partial [Patescibacteria group bacterium]|nr:ATP synthase subunit C [Patescibacteria group bacterium]
TQGSIINASTAVEKNRSSVWGTVLNLFGALLIFVGLLSGLMLLTDQVSSSVILILGVTSMLGLILVTTAAKSGGDEESIKSTMGTMNLWGILTAVVIVLGTGLIMSGGGGESSMIPETAWPLLMGALTMVGSAFCAAICIMTAVKAGAEMLMEKPELSIWSLLFVALGEGLAIYGLIVAILLIG